MRVVRANGTERTSSLSVGSDHSQYPTWYAWKLEDESSYIRLWESRRVMDITMAYRETESDSVDLLSLGGGVG